LSEQIEIDWDYPDGVSETYFSSRAPSEITLDKRNANIRDILNSNKNITKIIEPEVQDDISATLAQRGLRYGKFENHAKIAQGVQDTLRAAPNWSELDPDMRQALSVIADKMARILNGDPYYSDSWHDISGYATLVERRLVELEKGQ